MQETQYYELASSVAKRRKEFFIAADDAAVIRKMDDRLTALKAEGHTLVRRVKVGRNQPCPCGSGVKFKKCCIGKAA